MSLPQDGVKLVESVRSHPKLGRGSCSTIDECWSDKELLEEFRKDGIKTPQEALDWAMDYEGLQREKALNQRWGDEDDWQLAWYTEFKKT